MRFVFRVLCDAFMRFSQDDGWALASHIALSILTSLFPFLIFVTALAGFFGSASLARSSS
jgi:membrane protein